MKRTAVILSLIIFVCCVPLTVTAQQTAPVQPSGSFYINDYADVIGDAHRDAMLEAARSLYDMTGAQAVVLTVESLGGQTAEDYARAVFDGWEIGGTEKLGALMLVSPDGGESLVFVGQGLREILTDAAVERVQREKLGKNFAEGDYSKGIYEGFKDMVITVFAGYGMEASFTDDPEPGASGAKGFGIYTICVAMGIFIALRGFRVSSRYRKKYVKKGPIYQRKTYTRALIPDEDDYPSGFGGAVKVTIREPEDWDVDGGLEGDPTNDERT